MPSRRDIIRMTEAETRAYLTAQERIILVTNGPDGMPHPVPMNFGLDDDGRIVMTSFRKGQKVRNLERDPRASLLVESGRQYHELKGVMAYCDAEIIDDPARVRELIATIRGNESRAEERSGEVNQQIEASIAKRVILRFTPSRIISWDHAKLGDRY
jgi:PPOX class probable F420-dependent enzyme